MRKARQNLAQARRRVLQQMKAPENPKKNQRIDFFRGKVWSARQIVRDLERTEELRKTQQFMDSIQRDSDKNMKKLYSFMNRNRKPVWEKFGLKNKGGLLVTEEQDIKKELYAQWEKVYDAGQWPPSKETGPTTSLRLKPKDINEMGIEITEWELDKAINQLHTGTSAGTTDIPPELIKHINDSGRKIIFKWVRSTWATGELPEENDKSRSIFLHKKGSTSTLDNYRSITMGCNICKLYNRILTNRLQEGMESSDTLGEIQNGFRKGRRATDSLLVLETLIRKTKREKKKNFLALLDITKAYDRVDRDILWEIMEQMGVHRKLLNNIKSSYKNPSTTLQFQDVTSDILMLKLGLKQGCVMSPILFAIYIAELGRRLQDSSLGVRLDDTNIPGMFFADDMMLIGNRKDLQKLLRIVEDYALEFRIEFAGHKSSIISLGGPVDQNRKWTLGNKYLKEGKKETIYIEEENQGRYLGVTIQRNYCIFKPQWEIAKQKARIRATLVSILIRRCNNPLTILKPLWQSYIQPAFLYGTEIMEYNKSYIKDLETIQCALIKTTLRDIPGTATAGVYALTGITDITHEIWKRKLSYYVHIQNMSINKWATKAFLEQFEW